MLHREQGFGDTIQFIRYPPLVKAKGADVALMVQPELAPLMRRVMPDIQVVETVPPEATLHRPLMSLPRAFATDVETIPSASVWQADDARRAMWRVQLGASDRLRIGFAWRGSADHGNDQNRSLPLSIFLPLIDESVAWFGFQTRMPPTDQDALTIVPELQIFDEKIEDFEDTAALIAALDLIITADTSLAHLAGSMGRE